MCGARLSRILLYPAFVLVCLLTAASWAAGGTGDGWQDALRLWSEGAGLAVAPVQMSEQQLAIMENGQQIPAIIELREAGVDGKRELARQLGQVRDSVSHLLLPKGHSNDAPGEPRQDSVDALASKLTQMSVDDVEIVKEEAGKRGQGTRDLQVTKQCHLSSEEIQGNGQQSLIHWLPNELLQEILFCASLKDYLSMRQVSKCIFGVAQLPLQMELEIVKREPKRKRIARIADRLLRLRVARVVAEVNLGMAQTTLEEFLNETIDTIFAVLNAIYDKTIVQECCYALVANGGLGAELWKKYTASFLEKNANVDIIAKAAVTQRLEILALQAARAGAVETMDAIVSSVEEAGIPIGLTEDFDYALRWASRNGHVAVIKYLLEKMEKDPENVRGYRYIDPATSRSYPIRKASENGHIKVVAFLLEKMENDVADMYGYQNIDPAEFSNYALRKAAKNGHLAVVALLLTKMESDPYNKRWYRNVTPVDDRNYAIRAAAKSGHVAVVKLLLQKKEGIYDNGNGYNLIDPAAKDNDAIKGAAENGHVEMVELLLEKKEKMPGIYGEIDPAADDNHAIKGAARNGHVEMVKLLLDKREEQPSIYRNIDPIAKDNYAITQAARNGHVKVVKFLLDKKEEQPGVYGVIDPAAEDNYAIRLASENGHIDVVALLIAKREEQPDIYGDIDPSANCNHALMLASEYGHVDVVTLLLSKKEEKPALYKDVDPAANDNYAIQKAAENGHVAVVMLLLSKKEDNPELYGGINLDREQ